MAKIGISDFEIPAAVIDAAVVSSPPKHISACVSVRIDNNVALRSILPPNGRNDIRIKQSHVFWRVNMQTNSAIWREFAPSAAGGADPPSREGACSDTERAQTLDGTTAPAPDLRRSIFLTVQTFEKSDQRRIPHCCGSRNF